MAERHLLNAMQLYVDAVVQQSEDRTHDRLRSIDDYWTVRYHSSGCIPSFAAMELEMDIPEDIYQHPLLKRIRDCAVYLICAGNVSALHHYGP
jgi:Delta6-protoilludene synthase